MRYRNLIRQPQGLEAFGHAQSHACDSQRWQRLASRLAKRLSLPHPWPKTNGAGREAWENPHIPSGYTYLAQFVAHDCVYTSATTAAAVQYRMAVENRRSPLLQLETLYGGGPEIFPSAFWAEGGQVRTKFQFSRMRRSDGKAGGCPFRDIARAGVTTSNAPQKRGPTEALVPDPRNDVHAVASQLTGVFQAFHNMVCDTLAAAIDGEGASDDLVRYGIFLAARQVTTHVFRKIVKYDLLPTLLHPEVERHYANCGNAYVDPQDLTQIPVEFAQTLRFGHAMVRPFYIVNDMKPDGEELVDMVLATSAFSPWRMPLDETWMVQWSRFFPINGKAPNLSRRIGPEISEGLLSDIIFDAFDDTRAVGLPYRDLLSASLLRMWSVSGLIGEIEAIQPEMTALSPLTHDEDARRAMLRSWLAEHRSATDLSGEDIEHLAQDPPLLLFVLLEAASEMNGTRLGVLGSIILAEVLHKGLRDVDRHDAIGQEARETLRSLRRAATGSASVLKLAEDWLPEIASMGELIAHIAGEPIYREIREPAFV